MKTEKIVGGIAAFLGLFLLIVCINSGCYNTKDKATQKSSAILAIDSASPTKKNEQSSVREADLERCRMSGKGFCYAWQTIWHYANEKECDTCKDACYSVHGSAQQNCINACGGKASCKEITAYNSKQECEDKQEKECQDYANENRIK